MSKEVTLEGEREYVCENLERKTTIMRVKSWIGTELIIEETVISKCCGRAIHDKYAVVKARNSVGLRLTSTI